PVLAFLHLRPYSRLFLFQRHAAPRPLHSFPTRRSSDLILDGLRVWDIEAPTAELFHLEGTQPRSGPGGGVGRSGVAPPAFGLLARRGEVLATPRGGGALEVWSVSTGKKVREVTAGQGMPKGRMVTAPGGRWLAFSYYGSNVMAKEPPIFVLDPVSGKDLAQLRQPDAVAAALASSPDGLLLASAGQTQVHLWDMSKFQLARTFPERL